MTKVAGAQQRFEVMEQVTGRWTIRYQTENDTEAMDQAFGVLAEDGIESVKIIQYTTMPGTGRTFNKVIFHQGKDAQADGPMQLSGGCDKADLCDSVVDLYKLPAREIINVLFRAYLDNAMLTPTEVMHSSGHLRTLDNSGNLAIQAVGVVAVAQIKTHGGEMRDHQKVLSGLVSELMPRISKIEGDTQRVKKLEPKSLYEYGTFLRSQKDMDLDLRLNYYCTSISQTISKASGWEGKLAVILDLLDPHGTPHPEDLQAIDRFVSDILSGGQATKEILGAQATLGDALLSLTTLCTGKLAKKTFMPESLIKLNDMFKETPLKRCVSVLTGRVARELESGKKLTKDDADKEILTLSRLVSVLDDVDGEFVDNDKLREAIESRSRQQMPPEIYRIFETVSDPLERVKRLLKLAKQAHGSESQGLVIKSLRDTMAFPGVIDKWLKDQRSVLDKMRLLAAVHERMAAIPVTCPDKIESLKILDDHCFELMSQAKLLPTVESQGADIVEKANKLLLLAHSGGFTEGRTLDALKSRVLFYTQQPGFLKAFTADAKSPDEATQMLAEFRGLLQEARIV